MLRASLVIEVLRRGRLVTGVGFLLCLVGLPSLSGCHNGDSNQPGAAAAGDMAMSLVQKGQTLVAAYGCAGCHAPPGKQVLSGRLTPQPGSMAYGANLTPDSDTGIGDWKDADLTRAIRQGIDDEDEVLCPTMPRFTTLSDNDITAIIAYLRSQPATHSEIPESICPPIKPPPTDGGATDGP